MMVLASNNIFVKSIQNCCEKVDFSEIYNDDLPGDPFTVLENSIRELSPQDKNLVTNDITPELVASDNTSMHFFCNSTFSLWFLMKL